MQIYFFLQKHHLHYVQTHPHNNLFTVTMYRKSVCHETRISFSNLSVERHLVTYCSSDHTVTYIFHTKQILHLEEMIHCGMYFDK